MNVDSMSQDIPLRCQACRLRLASREGECAFRDVRCYAGTVLVHEGETPSAVWYVRRGQVAIGSANGAAREQPTAVRGPDTLIGLEALLGEPARYEAWALSDVVLCSIEAEQFRDWVGPLDGPAGAVMTLLLRETDQRAIERDAIGGTATQRVARILLRRFEETGDESFDVPLHVLASLLDMRAETLSRALASLRSDGVLAKGRSVRLRNLERLRRATRTR